MISISLRVSDGEFTREEIRDMERGWYGVIHWGIIPGVQAKPERQHSGSYN